VLFYLWFRDDPAEHPAVNEAERRRIGTSSSKPAGASSHLPIPWRTVLRSPNVWLMSCIMLVSATLFYTHFQWYATYLKEAWLQTEVASGVLAGSVMTAGALGCLFGGLLVDFVIRRTEERKWSRRLCGGLALLLAAISVAAVGLAPSPLVATMCFAAAMFFVQLAIPMWWTVVAEISGRHGASMWGLMNSLGGLGLMVVTKLEAGFVDAQQQKKLPPLECWHPVFYAIAGGLALGAVCWMLVDATQSIVGESQ
jgi:MFS transporter, ACS family, glucarate transporter